MENERNLTDLDDFDLDLDDDLLGGEDDVGLFGEEPAIPKQRVTEIVKKRLGKERDRQRKFDETFKNVYGMSPEEAIEFGRTQQQQQQGQQQQQYGEQGNAPVDPVIAKIAEIDDWRNNFEARQQTEREAGEFVQVYPNVKYEDIPKEVLDRRARGGVTLLESYRIHMADRDIQEAARKGAEAAARSMRRGDSARAEGVDYGGGGTDAEFINDEEREFAKRFGMSPKEYLTYKQKAKTFKEEEGGY